MPNATLPFSAALFDLDGTLLDSMWVWRRVDADFFAARGMAEPEDYARSIQGMSFRETAEYTVRRFGLPETPDQVMDEWTRMTALEYARRVELKPGALDYLRGLKRAGVKLAVVTANRPELFEPTLERCGALELFDAICTSAQVGGGGKADGALYRLAAEQLGIDPGRCAVFEDIYEGIVGAKRLGMTAYAVRDAANAHREKEIAALADGVVEDFQDMARRHPLPQGRCVIFTARCDGDPRRAYAPREGDFILCADGGWELARRIGVKPDLVIGDFDSSDAPEGEAILRFPVEKDDTDTMLCLKRGLALGYGDLLIVGGFGGRLDHTLANLQALRFAAVHRASARMADGLCWAAAVENGALCVPRNVLGDSRRVKLSVFALSDTCRGVTIRGAKYAMEDGSLSSAFPLGVSNEFQGGEARIDVKDGCLLVMVCGED